MSSLAAEACFLDLYPFKLEADGLDAPALHRLPHPCQHAHGGSAAPAVQRKDFAGQAHGRRDVLEAQRAAGARHLCAEDVSERVVQLRWATRVAVRAWVRVWEGVGATVALLVSSV